jgi:hypothetical protein
MKLKSVTDNWPEGVTVRITWSWPQLRMGLNWNQVLISEISLCGNHYVRISTCSKKSS